MGIRYQLVCRVLEETSQLLKQAPVLSSSYSIDFGKKLLTTQYLMFRFWSKGKKCSKEEERNT